MRPVVTGLVLAAALVLAPGVRAQARVTFVPSVSVSTSHDDNLFSKVRGDADFLTHISPTMEGRYESRTANLFGMYSFDMQRSIRHGDLNELEARRRAAFEAQARLTSALSFGFSGYYDRTHSPSELTLDAGTGILLDRRQAVRWQATPSLAYRVRPRTTIRGSYDWTTETLSRGGGGELHLTRLGMSRQSSPLTVWTVNYLGRMITDRGRQPLIGPNPTADTGIGVVPASTMTGLDPAGLETTDIVPTTTLSDPAGIPFTRFTSHGAILGFTRQLAPGASLTVQGGPRFTSYRGPEAEVVVSFIKRSRNTRLLADYWHGETIVLGIRGPVAVDSATAKHTWTVRRHVEVGAHFGAFHNTTLDAAVARVFHVALVTAWSPSEPNTLAISYGADFQKGDIRGRLLGDEQIVRRVLLVRWTFAPRLSRLIRPPESDQPRRGF